jgi:teichuronic acid biosynthesis glycosyltransferase TuaG
VVNDLVSIVTPAYNAASFVEETIRSVLAQTYQHWEMLIVDDCSRDSTSAIVEKWARVDKRIRLIRHEVNRRASGARETALEAAQGRYIAFLDSDDLWLSEKLERQLAFMRERDAALSYTSFRRISQDGATVGNPIAIPKSLTYRQLLGNTAIATSTAIVDRKKAGPFQITHTYYDDFALWATLLKRGLTAHGLREDLMRYRVVNNSLSRNKGKSSLKVWQAYRQVEQLSPLAAAWYFTHYAWNAALKYRKL